MPQDNLIMDMLPVIKSTADVRRMTPEEAYTWLYIQQVWSEHPNGRSNFMEELVQRIGKRTVTTSVDQLQKNGFIEMSEPKKVAARDDWPPVFDCKVLAKILGVSTGQARRIMMREDFKVTVISPRRHRIRREDLADWLERQSG